MWNIKFRLPVEEKDFPTKNTMAKEKIASS